MLRALILAIAFLPAAALADEAAIRKALGPLLAASIGEIRPAPIAGLFEVHLRCKPPAATAACDNPVENNVQLARRLGIQATPTVVFADGERHEGGLPLAELLRRVDHGAAAPAARSR